MEPRHGPCYDDILALALATERAGFDAFFRACPRHRAGAARRARHRRRYRPTDCWTTLAAPITCSVSRRTMRRTVYLHVYDIYDLDHVALIGAEVLPHVTRAPIGSVQLLERTGV